MSEKVFVDSSVFVSQVLEDKDYQWSRGKLAKMKNNPKNKFEPYTSHEALGEVKVAILEAAEESYVEDFYEDFLKYYSDKVYRLTTPEISEYEKTLTEVIDNDSRIDHTDAKIITQAIATGCNKIFTTDSRWSKRHDIRVVIPDG